MHASSEKSATLLYLHMYHFDRLGPYLEITSVHGQFLCIWSQMCCSTLSPCIQPHVPMSSQKGRRPDPPATPINPNLTHVLRDIGSVKLRSVPSIVR